MEKFPTIEEMAQNVAEKVLDEYEYKGKTLREWIEIILATDNNVGTKLSTNLAEVGTDCISRRQAIETFKDCAVNGVGIDGIVDALKQLPPIQPKRGRWEMGKDERFVECSECGLMTTRNELRGIAVFGKNEPNFCPNCGADMRGEQDG